LVGEQASNALASFGPTASKFYTVAGCKRAGYAFKIDWTRLGGRVTDKERFDGCMAIVNACHQRRRDREAFEWKLSIAAWTLIVLTIPFLNQVRPSDDNMVVRGIFAFPAFLSYWTFAKGVALAHDKDAAQAAYYVERAERIVSRTTNHDFGDFKYSAPTGRWAIAKLVFSKYGQSFQVWTTLMLLVAFCFLRTRPL